MKSPQCMSFIWNCWKEEEWRWSLWEKFERECSYFKYDVNCASMYHTRHAYRIQKCINDVAFLWFLQKSCDCWNSKAAMIVTFLLKCISFCLYHDLWYFYKNVYACRGYRNSFQMINVQKGFMHNTQIEINLRERLSDYCKLTCPRNSLQKGTTKTTVFSRNLSRQDFRFSL